MPAMSAVLSFGRLAGMLQGRKAGGHGLRVAAIVLSFAVLLASGLHHKRDLGEMLVSAVSRIGTSPGKGHPWQDRAAQGEGLRLHDLRSGFAEARIGMLLFAEPDNDLCRRMTFDNRTGALTDAGFGHCGQTAERGEQQAQDRANAMRKAFRK
jgi:hypothetical protein